MIKDPKITVRELVARVGKHEASRLLVEAGVSTSTTSKLVSNNYKSEVKNLVTQAIAKAWELSKKRTA